MLKDIFEFAQTASPVAVLLFVIILLVIAIFRLIVDKPLLQGLFKTTKKVSETQDERIPRIDRIEELIRQNEILLNNHFKHEIPDMVNGLARIEGMVGIIQTEQQEQSQRLMRVETLVDVIRGK